MLTQSAQGASLETHCRATKVEGTEIFYREAGNPKSPTILLRHGFPTSSHMFRDLIPLLADRYHLIAPDYPRFGYSSLPKVSEFNYTFDHLADVMEDFVGRLGLTRYALYMQDFGGPVGFRLATRRPQQVRALIIQNANAYDEGISDGVRDVVLRICEGEHSANRSAIEGAVRVAGHEETVPRGRSRSIAGESRRMGARAMGNGPTGQ